jgi:uncharacterized protein (TIGR02466 family)
LKLNLKVERLFATPVCILEQDDSELIEPLKAAIISRASEHAGVQRSNAGGWHSAPDFGSWAGAAGQSLIQRTVDVASSQTVFAASGASSTRWKVEAWANINRGADYNHFHGHGGAFWSAVYYVQASDRSGPLILSDPRYPMCAMHAPGLLFKDLGPQAVARVEPKAGTLVMFPSWLMHRVGPSHSEDVRISVALNLSAADEPEKK